MSPVKKICRQYSIDYLSYEFIACPQSSQLPMCLMWNQTLSNGAMKPSHLKYHLYSKHADQKEKPLSYFLQLKTSFEKRKTLISEFQKATMQQDNGMIASYNIALLVAKAGKSNTIGEALLRPVIEEVLSTVVHKKPDTIVKTILLSNNTISRRIDEMATDGKHQLIHNLQVDESTVVRSQCLMMVYVRFLMKIFNLVRRCCSLINCCLIQKNETSSRDPPAQQPAITGNQPIAIEGASSRSNQSNAIEGASSRSNNSRSRTIAFYRNEIPAGQNGAHIETILQEWSEDYNKLDKFNTYIQCLFPNRNPGQNSEAPLLTDEDVEEICSSPTLKERARRAFIMMLNFYGMELEGSCTITLASNHRQRLQQIISQDKYYLVITRILWFLKEINERQLMMVWLKFLADLIKEEKLDIDAKQSYSQYWINTLDHSDKNEIKEYIQQINRN